jgi:hypothetical protein
MSISLLLKIFRATVQNIFSAEIVESTPSRNIASLGNVFFLPKKIDVLSAIASNARAEKTMVEIVNLFYTHDSQFLAGIFFVHCTLMDLERDGYIESRSKCVDPSILSENSYKITPSGLTMLVNSVVRYSPDAHTLIIEANS